MYKSRLKALIYQIILPATAILIIYLLYINYAQGFNRDNQKIKIHRNKTGKVSRVNWMVGWSGQQIKKKLIEEFAREYEFFHQNTEIFLVDKGNPSVKKQAQEIVKMIRNNIYDIDIIWINENIYQEVSNILKDSLWGSKYLVDFKNEEGFRLSQKSEVVNNPYILNNTEGLLIGPYLDGEYGVLWYNARLASLIGLEIKDRNMNFEDLKKYAQNVQQYNNSIEDEDEHIATFCESNELKISILFQHLVLNSLETYNFSTTDLYSDSVSVLKEIIAAFNQLSQFNVLNKSHNVYTSHEAKEYFLKGKCLFMVGTTDLFNELKSIDEKKVFNILPAELPHLTDVHGYYGNIQTSYAVFNLSPNRNDAIAVLRNISTPEFAKKWEKRVKNPTGIALNMEQNYLENDPYQNFLNYIAKKYNYNIWHAIGASYLMGENYTGTNSLALIDNNLRGLLTNDLTKEDVYKNFKINITK